MMKGYFLRLFPNRNKVVIVFIPKQVVHDIKDACAVCIADKLIKSKFSKIFLTGHVKHISELVTSGFPYTPRRIALFAHSDNKKSGFPISVGTKRSVILPDWWVKPIGHKYNFLYAHVCSGATILSKGKWNQVFPNWLSYNKELFLLKGLQKSDDTWKRVFNKIIYEINNDKVDLIESRLVTIYENALSKTYDTYDEDQLDKFTMMYLNNALEALTSSN